MRARISLLLVALAAVACSKTEPEPPKAAAAPAPAVTAAPGATGTQPAALNSGKVFAVEQAGSYTYAEVEARPGLRAWMAGTRIEIRPGDTVQWGSVAVMRNFTAPSLGRTFPEILFVSSWGPAGATIVATPAHGSPPAFGAAPPAAGADSAGVVKSVASGGGYSYIEVDQGGTTVWVASMETPMKPGDKVSWQGGSEMRNFNAKSINRTFDRIIFATAVNVNR